MADNLGAVLLGIILAIGGGGLIIKPGEENVVNLKKVSRGYLSDVQCRILLAIIGIILLVCGIGGIISGINNVY